MGHDDSSFVSRWEQRRLDRLRAVEARVKRKADDERRRLNDDYRAHPINKHRKLVRMLAESQWNEPVVVVYLNRVEPLVSVPGRRCDGTVKGKRLIRRFFFNLLRVVSILVIIPLWFIGDGGSLGPPRQWWLSLNGDVTGAENAQALEFVDAAKPAKGPWLVYSSSHVAVIDTGNTSVDPAESQPPKFLWHATKPHAPQVSSTSDRLTWSDGSVFEYVMRRQERDFLSESNEAGLSSQG